jgi:hypothetical protein
MNGKTCRLTGNLNSEMQDNISLCSEGDTVTVEYDYDKEKYMATAYAEIGYFPKSAEPIIDGENGYIAMVERIEENENGKYVIYVNLE